MSTTYRWWEDRSTLQNMGIETSHDMREYRVRFRKEFETNNMLQYAHTAVDVHDLERGNLRPDDILRELQHVIRNDDDYVHPGPTNRDLRHPSVRNAWNEFLVIKRLAAGSKYHHE